MDSRNILRLEEYSRNRQTREVMCAKEDSSQRSSRVCCERPVRLVDNNLRLASPVIDEYDAKMPFKFAGTLSKIEFKLGPENLNSAQRVAIEQFRRIPAMATQ
jgi:hypothetical protein